MSLPNKPRFLVAKFFPFQQIQIVHSVWVRYNVIPVSTEEPNFDAFVEENLSEFFHGSLNSNVIRSIIVARGPCFVDVVNMINSFVVVEVIDKSVIDWAFWNFAQLNFVVFLVIFLWVNSVFFFVIQLLKFQFHFFKESFKDHILCLSFSADFEDI